MQDDEAHTHQNFQPLSRHDAFVLSEEEFEEYFSEIHRDRTQLGLLAGELAARCVDETMRCGDGVYGLRARLKWAFEFLREIQTVGRSRKLDQAYLKEEEEKTDTEKRLQSQGEWFVWERKDAQRSFQEGTNSTEYFDQDIDWIVSLFRTYLERSWARLPSLDFIFLDMMLTRETCVYAEEYKKRFMPGNKIFGANAAYFKHDGDLLAMRYDMGGLFSFLLSRVFWYFLLPVGLVGLAFNSKYETAGLVIGAIYLLTISVWVFSAVITWVAVKAGLREKPRDKPYYLLMLMFDTLHTLDGPVINPTRVREAMSKAANEGVVWSEAAWALIDRVIQFDPAVWMTQPAGRA